MCIKVYPLSTHPNRGDALTVEMSQFLWYLFVLCSKTQDLCHEIVGLCMENWEDSDQSESAPTN